jgi:dienelactone hydrolase
MPFATWLAGRGHRVLAIDFRGYGRSTAGTDAHALFEDVLAAVRYLHGRGVTRVAVLGASMGGGAAAEAVTGAAPGDIERVILLSPVPIADPEHLRVPVLFIASEKEPMVQVTEQYQRAPEPKRLVLLPGTAHGQHILPLSRPSASGRRSRSFWRRVRASRETCSCGVVEDVDVVVVMADVEVVDVMSGGRHRRHGSSRPTSGSHRYSSFRRTTRHPSGLTLR